jgi:hypothetical protein
MKDFGKWMAEQKPKAEPEEELPEGLYLINGKLTAICRVCDKDYEWCGDPENGFDQGMSYCGGSPVCCP